MSKHRKTSAPVAAGIAEANQSQSKETLDCNKRLGKTQAIPSSQGVQEPEGNLAHNDIDMAQNFFKEMYADSTEHNVELRICDNVRGRSKPQSVFTRNNDIVKTQIEKYATKDHSVYFGVCTRRRGESRGGKVNVVEMPALWVDIDCDKDGISRSDAMEAFKKSKIQPTTIIESGGGIHAYWKFKEAEIIDTPEKQKEAEAVLKQLADLYAGDRSVCEVARIMRLVGTLNTKDATVAKYGQPVPCKLLSMTKNTCEMDDVKEWIAEQQPFIERAGKKSKTKAPYMDPFSLLGSGYKAPSNFNVDKALASMEYGKDGHCIHETQLKATASLILKGFDEDDVVKKVFDATVKAAGKEGNYWDWDSEDIVIREMIMSAQVKIDSGEWQMRGPKILKETAPTVVNGNAVNGEWQDELVRGGRENTIMPKLVNAVLFLKHDERFKGAIALNVMAQRILLLKPIPAHPDEKTLPREWGDVDDINLQAWFEGNHLMMAKKTVTDAVIAVAHYNAFHPLQDKINSLEWDEVKRIDTWMATYLGVESSPYSQAIGRKFLIAAVARVLRPGCKVDNMLVLEGNQGLGKSTACSILCMNKDWFGDNMPDVSDRKAAYEYLNGKWIIEAAELNAMSKAESIKTKSFISSLSDRYRPAYGKHPQDFPRGCIFIGTINPEGGYLEDATGSRRYWPVKVDKIDLVKLAEDVEQLWAEAAVAFHEDEGWWLDEDLELAAKEAQGQRQLVDSWQDVFAIYITHEPMLDEKGALEAYSKWLKRPQPLTCIKPIDFLLDALDFKGKEVDERKNVKRVKSLFTSTGWHEKQLKIDNMPTIWYTLGGEIPDVKTCSNDHAKIMAKKNNGKKGKSG